jgi:hypothetical protein
MAITNAQQYKQLVNPPLDGKRPGYRGDAAYASKSEQSAKSVGGQGQTAAERDDPPGSTRDYGETYGSTPNTDSKGNTITYDPDAALAAAVKAANEKPKGILNQIPSGINLAKNFINNIPFIKKQLEKNRIDFIKDQYPEYYDEEEGLVNLPANLQALYDEGKLSSQEAQNVLMNMTAGDMTFPEYMAAVKGSPALLYSGNVGGLIKIKNPDGTFRYERRSDDGGGDGIMSDYERRLLELENQLKTQQAAAPTTTQNPFAYRFLADGGRAAFRIGSDSGKDTSGRDYASNTAASRSVATSPSRNTGGGGDNNNQPPQKINVPKPIKDAGNTAGELMFLKNVFELNPVGIMKNIGTKMFLDNLISEADTQQDQNMMLADVSAMDLKRKNQFKNLDYGTAMDIGMINPTMTQEEFEGVKSGEITEPTGQFARDGGRIGAMDGGIMNADMIGGMMDGNMDEMGRQMYGLGKLVKKATRGIKKIAKSPIGKAVLLNFAPALIPGGASTFFGGSKAMFGLPSFLKSESLKNFFLKDATKKFALDNLSQKGLMAGIAGLSALPFIFQGQEDEEEFDPYRGPDIDIDKIRSDPYGAMRGAYRLAADGGLMRAGYQEGGDAEPVAKKTMPLIDMDGKEKDYRETGGFVDMGRMERADDVPARLSKNEFVFTADAVRNAGEGDIDKGAEVMYNMMKNLEAGGEVSEESQGLEGARKMFQTSQRLEEVL